jgi:hypothetical protein
VFRGHRAAIECVSMLDDSWFITGSQDGGMFSFVVIIIVVVVVVVFTIYFCC